MECPEEMTLWLIQEKKEVTYAIVRVMGIGGIKVHSIPPSYIPIPSVHLTSSRLVPLF